MPDELHGQDFDFDIPEASVAQTLDQIREGGQHMVVLARERLTHVEKAIETGSFGEALERAQELCQRLVPLAQAETYIGVFAAHYTVRAADLTEGMELKHWGKITSVQSDERIHDGEPCHHIVVSFEDRADIDLHAECEVVAVRGE